MKELFGLPNHHGYFGGKGEKASPNRKKEAMETNNNETKGQNNTALPLQTNTLGKS